MRCLPLFFFAALLSLGVRAESIVHGPIIQWERDPATTATFQWVSREKGQSLSGIWLSGRAGFGYGDGDDRTIISGMQAKYRSLYIRHDFNVSKNMPADAEIFLEIDYDDAFVAYLNGVEVARRGVKGSGANATDIESHEAGEKEMISLGLASKLFTKGKNHMAIEGHNHTLRSSDFTLDPRLLAKVGNKERDVISRQNVWEYLGGATPEKGWKTKMSGAQIIPWKSKSDYLLKLRKAGSQPWEDHAPTGSRRFGKTSHTAFTVALDKLSPNTRYEYALQVVGAKKPVRSGAFLTAPATQPAELSFVTGGDMYNKRDVFDAMNARAGQEAPLFALLGGDLAYANGVKSDRWYHWLDSWKKNAITPDGRDVPMIIAIGNHEVKRARYLPTTAPPPSDAPHFYSLFSLPEGISNYALDFGNYLSFVILDSGHTQNVAAQTPWLQKALAERKKQKWIYACYHRPAYGTGVKGDAKDIQKEWSPWFEKSLVDAVFENDHHTYKRSYPIKAGKRDDENGVVYMGDGSWGVSVRKFNVEKVLKERPWLAVASPSNHLIRVVIKGKGVEYTALAADGTVLDHSVAKKRQR